VAGIEMQAQHFAVGELDVAEGGFFEFDEADIAAVEFAVEEFTAGEVGVGEVAVGECAVFVLAWRQRRFGEVGVLEGLHVDNGMMV